MEKLKSEHRKLISNIDTSFKRALMGKIPWQNRLTGIKGFRGVGKTTMLLQYIKEKYGLNDDALYVSLDNIYFTANNLQDFIDKFVSFGGKHLFLDEVHKYENWSLTLKNTYDKYPYLKITFTGSSLLDIINSQADLSRRALVFDMQGLSFREYLNFVLRSHFEIIELDYLLKNHIDISFEISGKIKPLKHYNDYLKSGYYPFFKEDSVYYHKRIQSILNMIIDVEFPLLKKVSVAKLNKIKQLLYIIANSVPFKPNISKLAGKIGITRITLLEYLSYLEDSNIIIRLYKNAYGISLLQKPDKLYLENTNLAYALIYGNANQGNIRENFFLNQLKSNHMVTYPEKGDFIIDQKYLFEIGGKNKTQKQIRGIDNAFIVSDNIETGYNNKIPLWLFGFLY